MSSLQSKIMTSILKLSGIKSSISKKFESGRFHEGDMNEPPKSLGSKLSITKTQVNHRNVFTLSTINEGTKTKVLFLHGGAYIQGFARIHWDFFRSLIKETGCTVIAPDYPLAPEFTFKDSFEMLKPIYKDLISNGGSENLILMGDSSGGGFALALAQQIKAEGIPLPKRIILLSPWLDITMGNPELRIIEPNDPVLEIKGLIKAGKAYAGDEDPHHYLLSPINGELGGLPRISIFTSTRDILVADARRFKRISKEKGIIIDYFEYEEMVHDWILLYLPESKQAIRQIAELVLKDTE